MCGRYTQLYTWAEVYAFLNLINQPVNLRPVYNVCPTDPIDVVMPNRELKKMRWGLVPAWWNIPSTLASRLIERHIIGYAASRCASFVLNAAKPTTCELVRGILLVLRRQHSISLSASPT